MPADAKVAALLEAVASPGTRTPADEAPSRPELPDKAEATTSGSVGGFGISILGQSTPLPRRRKKKQPIPATFVVGGMP